MNTSTPKFKARPDAERLRSIASDMTYCRTTAEATQKFALIEIACRLENMQYCCQPLALTDEQTSEPTAYLIAGYKNGERLDSEFCFELEQAKAYAAEQKQYHGESEIIPLYAKQRETVYEKQSSAFIGLTDVEWMDIVYKHQEWYGVKPQIVAKEVCKLTEDKLREKNGGAA